MRADVLVFDHSKYNFAALKAFLIQYGYRVSLASHTKELESKLSNKQFDLLIVQENINEDELSKSTNLINTKQSECYVLTLIQSTSALDRVKMLELGADDCLSTPYHPKELLLKMEKLLRHKYSTKTEVIQTKKYSLNVKSGDLVCPWGKIWLRKKEFMILSLLIQQKNQVVSKQQLIERVWGLEETPLMSTIDVHVKRIREKMRDIEKKVIKTAYGVGYMFCEN